MDTRTISNEERIDILNLAFSSASLEVFLDQLQTLPGYYTSVEKQN